MSSAHTPHEGLLEVGCLSVQVVSARKLQVSGGGYMDKLLSPQPVPYCTMTLGNRESISEVGTRTAAGYVWNREQMFFTVKVPLECVVGSSLHTCGSDEASNAKLLFLGKAKSGRNKYRDESGESSRRDVIKEVSCGSTLACAAQAAEASCAEKVWDQLTLHARVYHRDSSGAKAMAGYARSRNPAPASTQQAALEDNLDQNTQNSKEGVSSHGIQRGGRRLGRENDRLIGECSLNLIDIVSGRAPHLEEWVPLDSEGALRLALAYDSVGQSPGPGDKAVLLCLSSKLDLFPLPVWREDERAIFPGSQSWLWAIGAGRRHRKDKGSRGFRVEEAGDDFYLLSYAEPEGWRCAVEIHRFLVHRDPFVPRPWSIASTRDHIVATPAASAVRDALMRAREHETVIDAIINASADLWEGARWTAGRWLSGGFGRLRADVLFACGFMDESEFHQGHEHAARASSTYPSYEMDTREVHLSRQNASSRGNSEGMDGNSSVEQVVNDVITNDSANGDVAESVMTTSSHGGEGRIESPSEARRSAEDKPAPSTGKITEQAGVLTRSTENGSDPLPFNDDTARGPVLASPLDTSPPSCPITQCPMMDPAVAADGYTYEREAIERWLRDHNTSPVTGKVLETKLVFKNWSLMSSGGKPS